MSDPETHEAMDAIAIIGMAGRFPQARNVEEFWRNLRAGLESVSFFTDQELEDAGVDPAVFRDPRYVRARAVLEDPELFDAHFFGFNPREAEVMDPQHRLLLECAWEALEAAGYDPDRLNRPVGVFAGSSPSSYRTNILSHNPEAIESVGYYQIMIGNEREFVPTRVSYKLNLTGPSVNVQTACSTSLVAIHLACQSLLNRECDMALAGGVSVHFPQKIGYFYEEEGICSPDGHCRAFDANARGTVGGEGVGVVVLKRLADALADGDSIHAVIRGSAINNDGSLKVGFTAPSVEGQAEVIAAAHALAGVDPQTITYVETHGTGTLLGDPIEIQALTKVFCATTEARRFCAIGSVKTNIGHLDAAAGVAGLIKTVLALKHKQLPPSLNFQQPNPHIDFEAGPFYVNTTLAPWRANGVPRRAGVSSFGIGGTNAHVVLEEAPRPDASGPSRPWQLLLLSAKTQSALEQASANLAGYLHQHPDVNLADIAFTLALGRRAFPHRRVVVCQSREDAIGALEHPDTQRGATGLATANQSIAFMFPGQGSQQVNMARELYHGEPSFRKEVDRCASFLQSRMGLDLLATLYPPPGEEEASAARLRQTAITQPALFTIEYALARLLMGWGVEPDAMVGHSLGEYVAACLAGVFSLEEALGLVAERGRLIGQLPAGAMLAVPLPETDVRALLADGLSIAAVNAPQLTVVSGPAEPVERLDTRLAATGVQAHRLNTSHAFHSGMMDPVLDRFAHEIRQITLAGPCRRYLSNVTGTWITASETKDPSYWARHMRHTVRFADSLGELLKESPRVLLEVGPGQTLSGLARQHPSRTPGHVVLPSLPHPHQPRPDVEFLMSTLGQLWLAGVTVDWERVYASERRIRLQLPTYPFERERYVVEPRKDRSAAPNHRASSPRKKPDIADWFSIPSWKRSMPPRPLDSGQLRDRQGCWLVFDDESSLSASLAARLRQERQDVISVRAGARCERVADDLWVINPAALEDYTALVQELTAAGRIPDRIVHLWSLTDARAASGQDEFEPHQERGYFSLLFLARAFVGQHPARPLRLVVVSSQLFDVAGGERTQPEKSTLLGPVQVIPQEQSQITCQCVDIELPAPGTLSEAALIGRLVAETLRVQTDFAIAYRGDQRLVQTYEPVRLEQDAETARPIRERGVYLITGGFGRVGLLLAEYLARTKQAKLVLLSRAPLPERAEWSRWLETHGEQETVSRRIRKVLELEALGAEVMVADADVADEGAMRSVMRAIDERFGALHGVLHAAAVTSGPSIFNSLTEIGREESETQFRPKVHGTYVLETVLGERELDFCLLFSSNASVLGGLGFAAYSAANHFLDAFASDRNRTSRFSWISATWDGWLTADPQGDRTFHSSMDEYSMMPAESAEAFRRVVSMATLGHVVISTGDLPARLAIWIRRESARPATPEEETGGTYSRPALQNACVAPGSETEQAIAEIWQKLLGLKEIGVHDNFFELGGHSLLGTQLISRMREAFKVELSLRSIFEAPTIAELATTIESAKRAKAEQGATVIVPRSREAHRGTLASLMAERGDARKAS